MCWPAQCYSIIIFYTAAVSSNLRFLSKRLTGVNRCSHLLHFVLFILIFDYCQAEDKWYQDQSWTLWETMKFVLPGMHIKCPVCDTSEARRCKVTSTASYNHHQSTAWLWLRVMYWAAFFSHASHAFLMLPRKVFVQINTSVKATSSKDKCKPRLVTWYGTIEQIATLLHCVQSKTSLTTWWGYIVKFTILLHRFLRTSLNQDLPHDKRILSRSRLFVTVFNWPA